MRPIIPLRQEGFSLPRPRRGRAAGNGKERKGNPKSRSGCGTCKIRKVKCDEAKPICTRCATGGFDCDGYAGYSTEGSLTSDGVTSSRGIPESSDEVSSPETSSNSSTIQLAHSGGCPELSMASTIQPPALDHTMVYCEQFYHNASQSNGIFYYSKLFASVVLHESIQDKCIRNAIFAIGAFLYDRYLLSRPETSQAAINSRQQISLQFYNTALMDFSSRMQSPHKASHKWILYMTLLLAIFELLHGDFDAADGLWDCALQVLHPWLSVSCSTSITDSGILQGTGMQATRDLVPLVAKVGIKTSLPESQWTSVMLARYNGLFDHLDSETYSDEASKADLSQLLAFLEANIHQEYNSSIRYPDLLEVEFPNSPQFLWCVAA
ncbi:uncharacterized protein B0J16DRAFT_363187 [Fusarium flagelliforme]|uniref:uncharacterized protein n=1 Tax=Fusarium flagelliforme TaxID=2675880 RepID=UPI001E8DDDB0|nr:uncharacterized protein B0J16DRAFT_363187 [Fusarium flagelliforme]KAH7186188.1 hypothetical protein B0J16DRAFT_363187 [Fusarium flagelliforme]